MTEGLTSDNQLVHESGVVPVNYDQFAAIYDIDMGANIGEHDIEFYRSRLIGRSPVLELGCGTGRIMRPLVQAGCHVIGIDLSERMLERAKVRLGDLDSSSFELKHGNIADFTLPSKARSAICAFSTYSKLLTVDEQNGFFDSVSRNLEMGGLFIVDMFVQGEAFLRKADGVRSIDYERRWFPERGCYISRAKRVWKNFAPSTNKLELEYTLETNDLVPIETICLDDFTRYSSKEELEAKFLTFGFEIEAVYGDYVGKPFRASEGQMIFQARKRI